MEIGDGGRSPDPVEWRAYQRLQSSDGGCIEISAETNVSLHVDGDYDVRAGRDEGTSRGVKE